MECDEVTDSSNKDQVPVCLRWINVQFEPNEEFNGLHHVPDITPVKNVSILQLKDTVP